MKSLVVINCSHHKGWLAHETTGGGYNNFTQFVSIYGGACVLNNNNYELDDMRILGTWVPGLYTL